MAVCRPAPHRPLNPPRRWRPPRRAAAALPARLRTGSVTGARRGNPSSVGKERRAGVGDEQGLTSAGLSSWHGSCAVFGGRERETKTKGQIETSRSLKPEWKWRRGVSWCRAEPGAISICFLICFEPSLSFGLAGAASLQPSRAAAPWTDWGDLLGDPHFLQKEEGLAGSPET